MQIYDDPTWSRAAFIWVTQAIALANHNTNTTEDNAKKIILNQKARENARNQVTIGPGFRTWLVEQVAGDYFRHPVENRSDRATRWSLTNVTNVSLILRI